MAGVFPLMTNPTEALCAGTPAEPLSAEFNATYRQLIAALHMTFNGEPGGYFAALGLMIQVKQHARALVAQELAPGQNAGPTFWSATRGLQQDDRQARTTGDFEFLTCAVTRVAGVKYDEVAPTRVSVVDRVHLLGWKILILDRISVVRRLIKVGTDALASIANDRGFSEENWAFRLLQAGEAAREVGKPLHVRFGVDRDDAL